MTFVKLTSVGAAVSPQAGSESFLQLAQIADSSSDPKVRRQADFFDGCHWLAVGNIDEAADRFQKVRSEVPQADAILKKLEADRLRFANLSALEAWDLYNREAEAMQKDVDQGYLARIFSSTPSLERAREKRFGPERKLIQELKRRIEAGEAESLIAGLKQIQENGPEQLKDLSAFLLSKDAKTYVGDPRPALIEFASSLNPKKSQVEFLLQRTAELERQSDMPSTCFAVNALVRGLSSHATASTGRDMERLSSSGQFAATLAKLALSANAEGVASDVALMFASAGLGNLAKLSALTKLEKLGFSGYRAVAAASAAGIGVESTAFWAGNTVKDAAVHDAKKVLKAEQLAQRYGATLLLIGGLKAFGKLGEGLAASVGENPSLAGRALVHGMKHGSGLAGLTASNQLNQALGWQEKPQGGFAESFAGDLFSYVEFAAANKMADRATGQALSKIQEKQQSAMVVQEQRLRTSPPSASTRRILLHPGFAPLWAFLGAGGMGGGGGIKPNPRGFLEAIESEIKSPNEDWHHKMELGAEVAAGSHRGIGYDENNEDRYYFAEKSDGKTLLVAIDGLGGHHDGEQASAIAHRAFQSGTLIGLSVPEIFGLAHQTIEAYTQKNHPPSWRTTRRGRKDPGAVAVAVEIEPGKNGEYKGRFWNIGDAEAVVLRISPEDGSVQVVHHTTRPPTDSFERKRNGEPFSKTTDGRLDLADIFDHRLIDSPVDTFLGDQNPNVHYQRKTLRAGDIVLVGSDGFFENFRSFDLIGKIIAESGAKTSAQVHEALFQESRIRMALLDIGNNQELTHEVYVEAYRRALGKEPPPGWKGMYEPTIGPDGERKSHIVYYRGILDMDTGQVVDTLKQDNLTLLVQVLGKASSRRAIAVPAGGSIGSELSVESIQALRRQSIDPNPSTQGEVLKKIEAYLSEPNKLPLNQEIDLKNIRDEILGRAEMSLDYPELPDWQNNIVEMLFDQAAAYGEMGFVSLSKVNPIHYLYHNRSETGILRNNYEIRVEILRSLKKFRGDLGKMSRSMLIESLGDIQGKLPLIHADIGGSGFHLLLNGHHRMAALISLVGDGILPAKLLEQIPVQYNNSELRKCFQIERALFEDKKPRFGWKDLMIFHPPSLELLKKWESDRPK